MAAISSIVAIASLAVGVASYAGAQSAQKDAARERQSAAESNKKIQEEQRADNAAKAASERRNQIREERVRRAKILQGAENSGAAYSSGEAGALGGMATQLGSNIGSNLGQIARSDRISGYAQSASNSMFQASIFDQKSSNKSQLFNLSTSLFSASGGFGQIGTAWDRGFSGPPKGP